MLTLVTSMDELLQLLYADLYQSRRRRHELCIAWAGSADPVLAAPEIPWQAIGTATSGQ